MKTKTKIVCSAEIRARPSSRNNVIPCPLPLLGFEARHLHSGIATKVRPC